MGQNTGVKILLGIETVIAMPVFFLSWFGCAVWFAIKAGRKVAQAEASEKQEVLQQMFTRTKS